MPLTSYAALYIPKKIEIARLKLSLVIADFWEEVAGGGGGGDKDVQLALHSHHVAGPFVALGHQNLA